MDVQREQLLTVLKDASYYPDGIALHRVGKNPGLVAGKTGVMHEVAQLALELGYLAAIKQEGKADWVKLTQRGEQFLREHQDPRKAVAELLEMLQMTERQMPRWLAEVDAQLAAFRLRVQSHLEQQGGQLQLLIKRAESALRRMELNQAQVKALDAWQMDALAWMEWENQKLVNEISLADLFGHLQRAGFAELTIPDFHEGLLRLQDRGAVRLVELPGTAEGIAEPEYLLANEGSIYYSVRRG